jgi:exopolysaccharide biosynthesis operon protein EpsL
VIELSAVARLATASAALLVFSGLVHAQELGLRVSASYSVQQDSNLFRISPDSDPFALLGRVSTSERLDVSTLRVQYTSQFSMQEVYIDVGLADYDYQLYDRLDLLARNYDVRWNWSLTPRLRGKVRAERDSSVGSFDDAQAIASSNQRLRRSEVVDASYELDGVWRLLLAVQRVQNRFDQPQLGEDGTSVRSTEAGIRFDAPSGSVASLRWRSGTGRTLTTGPLTAGSTDDFDQSEWLMDLRWQASGKTVATASLVHVSRDHTQAPTRNFSGTGASIATSWEASAKSLWTVRWSSELSAYNTTGSSTARTNRFALTYAWSIGPRTRLRFGLAESRLRLGNAPPGVALNTLRNTTRERSLGLQWEPSRNLALEASLVDSRRLSNRTDQRFSNLQATASVTLLY